MSLRRVFSVLCLGLCAIALVGCGGDTFSLDPVATAASKTAESSSARFTFSATVTAGAAGTLSMSGNGLFDGRSKSGWMNMRFNMPAAAQAQLGANPSMEMIFDGRDGLVMYMRSSMFPGVPAETWVKMDVEELAEKEGIDLDALMNANQADPSQLLGVLTASDQARAKGSDVIRGVPTTRYALRIDLRRLAEQNETLREGFEKLMGLTGVKSFPAEAWIDAQDRVRRLKITMSMSSQFGGRTTMTMTEDLYDFGVRVNVHPPADSQVVDVSQFLGG